MIATNVTIIRKAYDDFAKGNIPVVLGAFDAAITWHVPGHSLLSGDYKGHNEIVGFFKRTLALSGGIFAIRSKHRPVNWGASGRKANADFGDLVSSGGEYEFRKEISKQFRYRRFVYFDCIAVCLAAKPA
jgi:ketosteroid isomerase-like protein